MPTDPRTVVEEFLARMEDDERRDTIAELCTDSVVITVPGARFEGADAPDEFLEFLAPRYEWIAKEFDRWYTDGNAVVSVGTLYGVNNDGEEFDGVRYVDVYELEDGLVTRLDIYNDLAVAGVL